MNKNYIFLAIGIGTVLAVLGLVLFPSQKVAVTATDLDTGSSTITTHILPAATSSRALLTTSSPDEAAEIIEEIKPVPKAAEEPTVQPTPAPTPAPAPVVKTSGITMSEVQTHDSKESCWTVVSGSVYDVTSFISKHPGGASKILSMCGKDSTRAFLNQHEGDRKPEALLASFRIDTLAQ